MEDDLIELVKTILIQTGSNLTEQELLSILRSEADRIIQNSYKPE